MPRHPVRCSGQLGGDPIGHTTTKTGAERLARSLDSRLERQRHAYSAVLVEDHIQYDRNYPAWVVARTLLKGA